VEEGLFGERESHRHLPIGAALGVGDLLGFAKQATQN
jgi:hypothetical protein